MPEWDVQLDLDPDAESALFVQIADQVAAAIRNGRLAAGRRLPGSRTLARSLGVHRNTVLAAFDELKNQGWIRADAARGTFVDGDVGRVRPRPNDGGALADRTAFSLGPWPRWGEIGEPPARDVLVLHSGTPDVRLFPADLLGRAYRRVVRQHARTLLDYGDARGHVRLRRAIADMLASRRGLPIDERDVLVTRGSQMALWLVARAIIRPGDVVAIEGFAYPPAVQAFRDQGAVIAPVPVDDDGLRVEALEQLLAERTVRAIYVTPHHQFPTLATLHPARRLRLLELARKHRFAVIEDDYDNEYHFSGRPLLPLASSDRSGSVVYVGTLSKVLAPALRIGYAVAPAPLLARMAGLRTRIDRQGDAITECAVAELMEDGEAQRHIWRTRRVFRARRDALAAMLRERLDDVLDFRVPTGGLALWARVRGVDVDAWAERALARGVSFAPASAYSTTGRRPPYARFGFGRLDEVELARAVDLLATARISSGHQSPR